MERSIGEMRILRISFQFGAFVMLFVLMACSSTIFSSVWKDETYQGHPEKILVINAFPNPATRRLFEDEFVKALKERGVDAVVSYAFMPDRSVFDKDAIAEYVKVAGADTVLITKPIGTTKDEIVGAGGVTYKDVYVNTQTDAFDMKSNKVVMKISAETWIRPEAPYLKQIQSYVNDLVKQLSKRGFI
ncbi:MAG: hypothetical protein HGB21_00440 [Nitrospirae bacterium]|nr:hypothetical protein [Nitrospirota bacterium]